MTTTAVVLYTAYGVMWCQDIVNTDGTIWHRKGEVEEYPNFTTAKTHLCIYRRAGWPVRLVVSKVTRTPWEVRG